MIYLKAALVGLAAAVTAVMLSALAIGFVFAGIVFMQRQTTGSGGIGAVSSGIGPILAIGLVAFVAGFYWQLRRGPRGARRKSA
jgi:hypothetical protein